MSKQLTVGRVKFQVKVDMTEHAELGMRAQAAGVRWDEALEIMDARLNEAGPVQVAARAVVIDMLSWSPEMWAQAKQSYL